MTLRGQNDLLSRWLDYLNGWSVAFIASNIACKLLDSELKVLKQHKDNIG